jgi:hypothetical protein
MLCRVHAAHVRTCMRTDMCVFVLYTHTHTHTHYTPLDAYVACTVYRKTTGKAAQAFAKILFIFLKKNYQGISQDAGKAAQAFACARHTGCTHFNS